MNYQKNMRFIIFRDSINSEIIDIFKDLYKDVEIVDKNNHIILYFIDKYFENINELIEALTVDFEMVIHYHEGFMLNNNVNDDFLNMYVDLVIKYDLLKEPYTNLFSLVYLSSKEDVKELLNIYISNILSPIVNKNNNRIILNKFFDNNLNVLKTSKDLFINRNSLTLRLESISKAIGYDIQEFKVASMIMLLLNMKS